jgi:hypothetical protein
MIIPKTAIPIDPSAFPIIEALVSGDGINEGDVYGLLDPGLKEISGPTYERKVVAAEDAITIDGHDGYQMKWIVSGQGEIWTVAHLALFDSIVADAPIDGLTLPMAATLYGSLGASITFRIGNITDSK